MPFPALTLTNGGATRLLQAGVLPTHMQYSSAMIAAADLATQTTVAGVLVTVSVTEAVVANESQFLGVDDNDANAYTTFRCVVLWHVPDGSNPGDAGSVLLAIDSTGNAATYGDKVADIDLIVSGSLQLTDAQAANITFGSGTVLQATESRHGITRYSTDDEDDAGTRDDRSSTPKGAARYVAAWWATATVAANKLTGIIADTNIPSAVARLASPTFTGSPTAPTPGTGNNSTRIANTEWVRARIAALVNGAPGALDTLNELADALGDDSDFATTVNTALAARQQIDGYTTMTQAEYDALAVKVAGREYRIRE